MRRTNNGIAAGKNNSHAARSKVLLISLAVRWLARFGVALAKYEIDFIKSRMKLIKSDGDCAPDASAYEPLVTSKLIFSNSNL